MTYFFLFKKHYIFKINSIFLIFDFDVLLLILYF